MKLRYYIFILLLLFGLVPLFLAVALNLPLVLERTAGFYQRAYLQNLRADFRDLDQHLASRDEMLRMLAKLPGPAEILDDESPEPKLTQAQSDFRNWITRMLDEQLDIIQILLLDDVRLPAFWLVRDVASQDWRQTARPLDRPSAAFIEAAQRLAPGEILISRIQFDPAAAERDPRQLLTLQLATPVSVNNPSTTHSSSITPDDSGWNLPRSGAAPGLLLLTIDVGGLAAFYRDTLWVSDAGAFVRPGQPLGENGAAFEQFPGLAEIFAEDRLALWESPEGPSLLWVPMFQTEEGAPLWVARVVDPSPLTAFRDALIFRVLPIVVMLVLAVLISARWLARRAERFGDQLIQSVRAILSGAPPASLRWRGPREVLELGEELDALARSHHQSIETERQHLAQLEQSHRYKSEFLANVSHELRTPLNSILLLSKLLADRASALPDEQRDKARVIHEAGADLRAMIDNVLEISRIEAGAVEVAPTWFDPVPMLEDLRDLLEPLFDDKGLMLRLDCAPDAPNRIHSDRDKLRQILKNFLSNAAKFSDAGSVTLGLERGDARCPLRFWVEDQGVGIPREQQELIFEAFRQGDGSINRRHGGTGLGLSISRELAQLLGGRIELRSSPGQGARFSLCLPLSIGDVAPDKTPGQLGNCDDPGLLSNLTSDDRMKAVLGSQGGTLRASVSDQSAVLTAKARVDRPNAETNPSGGLPGQAGTWVVRGGSSAIIDSGTDTALTKTDVRAGGRDSGSFSILIVDDHAHNLYSLRTLIQTHLDAEVLEAASGAEAIALTERRPDIDLIVLDVQMPELDGFQTASLLKQREGVRDIPIIFLTAAFKSEEFQQRGYAVGAVDYLLKPIDDDLLINKISTYFRLIEKERSLNILLERQVAERTSELEQARAYLAGIIAHMGEALLILDREGRIKSTNPTACRMLGYRESELLGLSIGDVFEEEGEAEAGAFMGTWLEALIRTGALRDIEARFIAQSGIRKPILFSRTAINDSTGVISDIICIAKDMSGYVRAMPEQDSEPGPDPEATADRQDP